MSNFYDTLLDDVEQKRGLWADKSSPKVKRSNKAHNRLQFKAVLSGKHRLARYHGTVMMTQSDEDRVLSRRERKKIFKSIK